MHRYFLIPMIGFFIVILGFVIYLQFVNENWKYLVPKPTLPDSCDDLLDIEGMTAERAAEVIMTARAPWFAEEEEATA